MRSRSYIFLLIVVVLAAASGWLYKSVDYQYGLDVRGGVRFTYQIDPNQKFTPEQLANQGQIRANVVRILNQRVSKALGVVEGSVQTKGEDQFIVEIPGEKDIAKAERMLSTTASIEFYHAKTLVTELAPSRRFVDLDSENDENGIFIPFQRSGSDKVIKPGDPEYQAIIESWGDPIVKGEEVTNATPQMMGQNYIPSMTYSTEGSRKMESWSRRNNTKREKIAIVLDGVVLSVAPIENGAVLKGGSVITGQFETEYVKQLTDLIKSGALPVKIIQIRGESVDPTIGAAALDQILKAGLIAFAIIALFVVVYYVFPGIVALTALLLYVLFTLSALKMLGATFSLAAIAGFILSVGMAVDANILVFERLKEEIRNGKTLQAAIDIGFKRALPAIIDSNACTILTSLVLVSIGTGPVKGFATTLIIGVAISLFTAVVITRSLLQFLVGSGLGADPKWYGMNRQWFGEKYETGEITKPLTIIEKRNKFFAISVLTIIPGLVFFVMGGLKPNVEFTGGYEGAYLVTPQTKSSAEIADALEKAGATGFNIKYASYVDKATSAQERMVYITVKTDSGPFKDLKGTAAGDKLAEVTGLNKADQRGNFEVSPTVAKETTQGALLGVLFSSLLIILYLAIRFGIAMGGFNVGLRFSAAAIGALLHDVFVVIGLAAIFGFLLGWEVSALFITGMLTVIGFSTHDTIVIFDRIRENLKHGSSGEDLSALINRSIKQSIARSINTSSTVIVTLMILIFLGSANNDLRFFNVIMLCGIISGTYSSIWNASPILYVIDRWFVGKKGPQAGLIGIAAEERQRERALATQIDHTMVAPEAAAAGYSQVKRRRGVNQQGRKDIEE